MERKLHQLVFSTTHNFFGETPEQVCNTGIATSQGLLRVVGGGATRCHHQSNGNSASSCKEATRSVWQTGTGVPADGVRDVPDVSLFSSAGFFGAFYVVCQQSINADGKPCNLSARIRFRRLAAPRSPHPPLPASRASNQKTGSRQATPTMSSIISLINRTKPAPAAVPSQMPPRPVVSSTISPPAPSPCPASRARPTAR